jgi:hypothetical protein
LKRFSQPRIRAVAEFPRAHFERTIQRHVVEGKGWPRASADSLSVWKTELFLINLGAFKMPDEILLPKTCSICGREIPWNDPNYGSWPTDLHPEGKAHGGCIDNAQAEKNKPHQ